MQLNGEEWSLFNLQKKVRQIGEKKFYEVHLKKAEVQVKKNEVLLKKAEDEETGKCTIENE